MKLLLEKWNKYLKENVIKEADEEEIEMLSDMMEIPIEDYPFKELFGDRYRLIEPISLAKEDTAFGISMKALEKLGWTVNKPQNGKMLCTKVKMSHFIDGKGKVGVSKKPVSLNVTKVVNGIIDFVENKREKMLNEHKKTILDIAAKIIETPSDEYLSNEGERSYQVDSNLERNIYEALIYHADSNFANADNSANNYGKQALNRLPILITKEEYRKLYRFRDTQFHWTKMDRPYSKSDFMQRLDSYYDFDLDQMKAFKKEHLDTNFEDLLTNFDKYYNKYYIIYSRHPIDVLRMSDHEGIESCHDLPSNYGKEDRYYGDNPRGEYTSYGKWTEYSVCALAEALGNGMIAYAVPAEEFVEFPPTQESLDNEDDAEIFYDEKRPSMSGHLSPTSRIRIKHVSHRASETDEPIRVAVPESTGYPVTIPNFASKVLNKMATMQKETIKKIIGDKKENIDLGNFTRYGGEQQDNMIGKLIPKLFRYLEKDLTFVGSTLYNRDIQDTIEQKLGEDAEEYIREIADRVFDAHTYWPFKWSYEVVEDHYGNNEQSHTLEFFLTITFKIPAALPDKKAELDNEILEIIKYELTDYFEIPQDFRLNVRDFGDSVEVTMVYNGDDLLDDQLYDINVLEEMIDDIFEDGPRFRYMFDRYDDYSFDNHLIHLLEKRGTLKSDKYNLQNAFLSIDSSLGYFDDDSSEMEFGSWEGDIKMEETEFSDYYLEEATMYAEETLWIDEIFEKLSGEEGRDFNSKNEQHVQIAKMIYNAIASIHSSNEENMFNRIINYADSSMKDVGVPFKFNCDMENLKQNLLKIIKEEEGIAFRVSVNLKNYRHSREQMIKTVSFLDNNSIEDISNDIQDVFAALIKKQSSSLTERKRRVNIKVLKGK